jgi:hypothetical protein
MALGDLFAGLGQAVDAGVRGVQRGRIAGEQERHKRGLQEQDREYKRLSIAARKKELDPDEDYRKFAGQMALGIESTLNNPANRAYFVSTPEGQRESKRLQQKLGVLHGIVNRTISPQHIDQYTMSGAPEPSEMEGPDAFDGTPLRPRQELPFLEMPGSRPAPSLGMMGGMPQEREPMPDVVPGGAFIPQDAPPTAPMPPRQGPPDISASLRPQPKPAPPPTAMERYFIEANNQPKIDPIPGERPADTERRRQAAMREWNQNLTQLYQAAQLEDKVRAGKAKATISESDAGVRPEVNRQRVVGGVARIEGTRAQTGLNKALTPIKVEQGKAAIKKAKVETALAPRRVAVQEGQLGETKRHNRVVEEQRSKEFRDRVSRADKAASMKVNTAELTALQGELRSKLSRYQKTQTFGPFKETKFAVEGPARQKLGKEIDLIERRLRGIADRKQPTTSTSRSTTTTMSTASKTPVLGRKPMLPKGVNDKEYAAVKGLIKGGRFDGFARGLSGTDRARAKAIYRAETGRDWKG